MKRILNALIFLGFGFISANAFADDINFLLSNRVDVAQGNGRPQVLFIIDVLEDSVLASRNDESSTVAYRNNEPGSCYTIGSQENSFVMTELQLQYPSESNQIRFSGPLCSNGKQATKVTTTTRRTWDELTTKDPREIIKYIMNKRSDLEYGVISLKDYATPAAYTTSADIDLEVDYRTDFTAAFTTIGAIASHSGSSTPIAGGLSVAYDYLSDGTSSPLSDTCADMKLVLITNGGWTNDIDYAATTGLRTAVTAQLGNTNSTSAYLQKITEYIRNYQVKVNCTARVSTSVYGIGVPETELMFTGTEPVGKLMAEVGNGNFLNADTGGEIARSVLDDLDHSYPDPLSLSSPAVAIAVNRAAHKPTAFATAFEPLKNQRWFGNVTDKDLSDSTDTTLDPVGSEAAGAKTFANGFIATKTAANRVIKTNINSSTLRDLSGIVGSAETTITSAEYTSFVKDLPGGLADPIHFKPLAVDYGGSVGTRLLIGTNDGLLHMFDASGNELWAFLPKEMEKLVPALVNGNTAPNYMMVDHFYGVDGAPTAFVYDAPDNDGLRDGVITSADGSKDKVFIYFGLRRGGGSYYAMDITNPAAPTLLWTKGSMNIDYGNKFDISTGASAESNVQEDDVVVVESAGGCPVFGMYPENGLISSGLVSYICHGGTPVLVGSNETFDSSTWLTKLASVGGSAWVYFAGMGTGNQHSGSCSDTTPIFTMHNQCQMDLSGATGFTFEAHPAAMYSIEKPSSIGCHTRASRDFDGMAVGDDGEGESIGFVGFDMSSLPADAYITSAKITLAHTATNDNARAGAAYGQVVAIHGRPEYYGKGITVSGAGKTAEGGPGRDSSASFTAGQCADWDDDNHYEYIGQVGDPSVANYAVAGLRTVDGELYPADLYPDFYTSGAVNDKGISAMTQLFNHRNGDGYGHSWAQFKLQVVNLSGTSLVAYETPVGGEQIEDYANGAGHWANMVPKLTLTWQSTAPSSTASASEMEMSETDYWAVRGSGTLGGGSGGGSGSCTSVTATCSVHYAAENGRLTNSSSNGNDANGDYTCYAAETGVVVWCGSSGGLCYANESACNAAESAVTTYTVTATAGANGSVTPASSTVNSGSAADITVTADTGYQIDNVTGCGVGILSDSTYTTAAVSADCAVSATFEVIPVTTYTVTATAGSNGSVNPASASVNSGSTADITVTPDAGYEASVTSACGGTLSGTTFTTGAVSTDCAVSVSFSAVTYSISTTVGSNGSVTPASATVNSGATTDFTIGADTGYQIQSVSGCSGTLSGTTYTIGAASEDCAVTAVFELIPAVTYAVSTNAGANGSISPTSATVGDGNTAEFTITPDSGYQIATTSGCSGSLSGSAYTIGAASVDCTVSATFELIPVVTYAVNTSAGANGNIGPVSASVEDGSNTQFTITPDSGYQIASASGCGGSLTGSTYTTGAINSACTVSVTFEVEPVVSSCDALSPQVRCTSLFYPHPTELNVAHKGITSLANCTVEDSNIYSSTSGWLTFTCQNASTGESCLFKYGKSSGTVNSTYGYTDEIFTHEKDSKYYKTNSCDE